MILGYKGRGNQGYSRTHGELPVSRVDCWKVAYAAQSWILIPKRLGADCIVFSFPLCFVFDLGLNAILHILSFRPGSQSGPGLHLWLPIAGFTCLERFSVQKMVCMYKIRCERKQFTSSLTSSLTC